MYSISWTTCHPQPSVGIAYGKCGMTETVQVNLYIAHPSVKPTKSRSVWLGHRNEGDPGHQYGQGGWE